MLTKRTNNEEEWSP